MNFSELKLSRPLLRAVEEKGYTQPSPIQCKAIPPILDGYDLLGCAQTGTGKTAAFALPILQRLAANHPNHKGVRALILTPTRELAIQIDSCFADYGKYMNVSHTVIFGGVGQNPQVEALKRGSDVLTACPGRLNDLLGQGLVNLEHLEIFVLDEADRMLDMGFVHDVKKVLRHLPEVRQNLLFSATMPREIEELAAGILKKPITVKVNPPSSTVDRIEQSVYKVTKSDKKRLLALLLARAEVKNALVFSRTKHGANAIAAFLEKQGVGAAAIHGNKSQTARVKALDDFKSGKIKALVATDIAARGIDISSLSHVFQLDLPEVPETYVHRIGRTGRAGAEGIAVSFCCPDEEEYLAAIEKLIQKKIPVFETPLLPVHYVQDERQKTLGKEKSEKVHAQRLSTDLKNKKEQNAPNKQTEMEEASMAESKQSQTAEGQGLSASAKRRRRRRRAADREQQAQGTTKQPQTQKNQPERKEKQEKPVRQQKPQEKNKKREENAARQTQKPSGQPARQQPRKEKHEKVQQQTAVRSVRAAKQTTQQLPKPVRPVAAKRQAANEDPGLMLITRRPPAQKFANFEEYLKSRGLAGPSEESGSEENS